MAIRSKYESDVSRQSPRMVAELVGAAADTPTEYLLGQEPIWSDLKFGRAIERRVDGELYSVAKEVVSGAVDLPLIVGGTAGSGKSTSLMRLGIRLAAEGILVYWIDANASVDMQAIEARVRAAQDPVAILIDDADTFGRTLTGWMRELPKMQTGVLCACALRTTKIDGLVDGDSLGGIEPHEIVMPPLEDDEIDALIALLDTHNRLGILKGMDHAQRVGAFRKQAGRQLLVAMIQATSGKPFKQKIIEEFVELSEPQRFIYAAVCLVHSQRYEIDRSEILHALGSSDNRSLNELDTLVRRHLITRETLQKRYGSRHRVIADEVVDAMRQRDLVGPVLEGLCFSFAQSVDQTTNFGARSRKRLTRFVNHDFLYQMTHDIESCRKVYSVVESLLTWDYHYWLQRGSLEVEVGDLALANQFLDQSRSLRPDDPYVRAEYGYLLMKQGVQAPESAKAASLYSQGFDILRDLIEYGGRQDSYPYHILGSQGLAWTRRATLGDDERRDKLRELVVIMEEAQKRHPKRAEIITLTKDVKQEFLMTAVQRASTEQP